MKVYLDNASTTNVSKEVYKAMKPYFLEDFGNPSSLHQEGIKTRKTINSSRKKIAKLLHCDSSELHFTSCGTESINWALKGLAFNNQIKGEIITTKIEHHATLHTCEFLESLGYIVHYLTVDNEGFIDLEQLKATINDNTLVVSVIMANNEIGTIQDMKEIAKICMDHSTYLHVDAVQVAGHIPLNLSELGADLVSFSGHKFHAPKGIGLLYIKKGTHLTNLLHGGQQENGMRPGTENVPYIVGLTKALECSIDDIGEYQNKLRTYTKYIKEQLDKANIDYVINGPNDEAKRLPGNLNISFKNVDGGSLVYYLNKAHIYVSTGSACDSKSIQPSHVIKAINVPKDYINATIRISVGNINTFEEIAYATKELIRILQEEQIEND